MSSLSSKLAVGLLVACVCLPSFSQDAVAQRGGVHKPVKRSQPDPLPPYTPEPLQPLPLDQMPTVAPVVTLQDGHLTIVAHNCTLADVLRAIRKETGAELDIPPGATERVVADLGPGSPREVIADLLNGTHFNYVMVGSSSDPTAVQSIALTPKSGGSETAAATQPIRPGFVPQRGFQQRASIPPVQGAAPTEGQTPDGEDASLEGSEDNGDQGDVQAQEDQPQPQPDQNQQAPKTPEQLLQELQRQQQQSQQPQSGQPIQGGIFPNQPPTAQPATSKPD